MQHMPLLQQTTQEVKINSNAGALDVCSKSMHKRTTEVTYICRNAYLMGHQTEASPEVKGSLPPAYQGAISHPSVARCTLVRAETFAKSLFVLRMIGEVPENLTL
jgi:hypothetical protein